MEGEQQPEHQLPSLQQRASSSHPVPTAGRGHAWGQPQPQTEQCRHPVTDFDLQALGSRQALARHHLFTGPKVVDGSCCPHTSGHCADNSKPMVHQLWAFRASPFQQVCVTSANLGQAMGPAPGAGASAVTVSPQDRRSQEQDVMLLKLGLSPE